MKKNIIRKCVALLLTLAMLTTVFPYVIFADADFSNIRITYTENPEPIFKNPGKGFIRYTPFDYDSSDPVLFQKSMDYSSVGYNRYYWSVIEPKEGQYNWDLIDKDIDACTKNGLRFTFGIMDISIQSYIPDYVWEAGANYETYTFTSTGVQGKAPYLDDPVFQEKKNNFLKAVAERYDGDDRIAYIDARIWGNYGEGHYGSMSNTPPAPSPELQMELLDMYLNNFKKTQIVCVANASNNGGSRLMMQIPGVGMRCDGIGMRQRNAGNAIQAGFLGVGPTVFESAGTWSRILSGSYGFLPSDEFAAMQCRSARVSYYDIGEWGIETEDYVRDNEELILNLANQIGYHFVLKAAELPNTAKSGDTITVSTDWQNKGLAYMYENCEVEFAVLDNNDNVVSRFKTDIVPTRNWSPDVELIKENAQITMPDAEDGNYKLAVGLFWNERYDKSDVKIGNYDRTKDGWYVIADATKSGDAYTFSYNRDEFTVNGAEVKEKIITRDGVSYYPLHNVFALLGGRVKVDGNKVTVLNDDYNLEFTNNSDIFKINGISKNAFGAMIFENGIPYVSEKVFYAMPILNYSNSESGIDISDTTYAHINNDYEVGVVPNGSFEKVDNAWSYNETLCERTSEIATDGEYSMKLNNTNSRNMLSTRLKGENKQVYYLKFSVKADTPVSYEVRQRFNTILAEGKTDVSDDFAEYSVIVDFTDPGFNVDVKTTNEDPILTFSTSGGGEAVYIDNVRLEKYIHYDEVEVDPQNLDNNYDFEVSRHGWFSNSSELKERSLCPDNPHTGKFCLKALGTSNWSGLVTYVKDAVKKAGPGTYKIEIYARTDPGETMQLFTQFGDRDNANYGDKDGATRDKYTIIDEKWQKIEMIETVDKAWVDGMSNCCIAAVYCRNEDVGKAFYIDSVKLVKISD